MCNLIGCLPDDQSIENMDPYVKMWCFYNWIEDQNDKVEMAKNHAYIVGSFINPEAVRKILDDNNNYSTSDEEFEASSRMVIESREKYLKEIQESGKKKRRRRKIKE